MYGWLVFRFVPGVGASELGGEGVDGCFFSCWCLQLEFQVGDVFLDYDVFLFSGMFGELDLWA